MSLTVGDEKLINVNWMNASPTIKELAFESSNEDVCTVSDSGVVKALSAGSSTITVMSTDDSKEIEVTVSAEPAGDYVLVTDASTLKAGDKLLFVSETAKKCNGGLNGNNFLAAVDVSISNHTISSLPTGAAPLTLGGTSGSWTFTINGNYTLYSTDSAFSTTSSTSSYNTYTIAILSNNATIKANGSYQIYYNSGSPRFRAYTSAQAAFQLYKKTDGSTPAVTNYTVSFDKNGGSGTMDNATTNGSSYVVPECSYTYEGYTFDKWALGSATGTQYAVGETISDISENITLYALWTKNQTSDDISIETTASSSVTDGAQYVIGSSSTGTSFLGALNGSWGAVGDLKGAKIFTAEGSGSSSFALKCDDGYLTPKTSNTNTFPAYGSAKVYVQLRNTNEIFSGANDKYNLRQNSTSGFRWYGSSSVGTTGTAAKLYKVISGSTPTPTNYTVSFNSNGGSGTMANATTNGSSYTVPSCEFTYTGYTFDKWALNSASGAKYAVGDTITGISANITLYATWTENSTPTPDYGDYYKDVNTSSLSNIQSTLHSTISANTVDVGYDGLFNAYKTTDVKPGTNYFWDMYSNENYTTTDSRINANYSGEGDSINREHTIPQSWFNESSPMKADLFHVYPTDGYVNNRRSNYPHADVSSATYTSKNGSKLGTTNNSALKSIYGNDAKFFEVIDEYKGDFARSYFYFATRYSDKISSFTADGKKMFKTSAPYMASAFIDVYYQWHLDDPVSEKEINRNNAVYSIQKNRNPYIDHPEWVAIAFGKSSATTKTLSSITLSGNYQTTFTVGDTFSYTGLVVTANYSDGTHATVTPTSVSSPNMSSAGTKTVTVTYTEGETTKTATYDITVSAETTDVTSITLSQDTAEINVGETLTLVATVLPDNATDKSVTWSTSDNLVATVANGVVTGVSAGTATITAKTSNNKTATCSVTVKESQSGGSSGNYVKVTSALTDWSGEYLIVNETASVAFNGSLSKLDAVNNNFSVTISNDTIVSTETTEANNFTISKTDDNYWAIQSKSGYYIGGASSNGLSSGTSITKELKNTISFSNGVFTIKGSEGNGSKTLGYNSAQNQNRFRYMGNTSIQLYKKEAGSTPNPDTPQVTNIELDKTTLSLDKYDIPTSGTLTATVTADEGADTSITWESKDTSVATVIGSGSTATVNAIGEGTTKIIAKAGNKTAECTVTVTANAESEVVSLELIPKTSSVPYLSGTDGKTTVEATLTATFREGGSKVVTPDSSNFVVDTTSLGSKEITASYGGKTATAIVKVTNSGANIPTGGSGGTTGLTIGNTGVSSTSYTNFSYEDTSTGAKFGGKVSNNGGIQIKSGDSNTGIIQTASAGKVTKITISYTKIGNGFQIYGKNSAYGAASDLFNTSTQGTLIATVTSSGVVYANANQASTMDVVTQEDVTTKEVTINGDFEYVGIRSINGAVVLSEIDCEFAGSASSGPSDGEEAQAKAWAQYFIEVTRTESACLADTDEQKLSGLKDVWSDLASEYSAMSDGAKDAFFESDDLTIVEAREHYKYIINKFGENNLTNFVKDSNNNTLPANKQSSLLTNLGENNSSIILVVGVALLGATAIGLYFASKKRKED